MEITFGLGSFSVGLARAATIHYLICVKIFIAGRGWSYGLGNEGLDKF